MYERNGVYYADFIHNGKRYVKSLKTSSKSVAKELERKFRVEVESGRYELNQKQKILNVKFNIVPTEYLEKESVHKKSHRRDKFSSAHLFRFFGNNKLSLGDLGGSVVFRDTKNGENRKVILTKELTKFLEQVIEINPFSEQVFCNRNGRPLKSIDGAFKAACKRVEINNLRFHDLRDIPFAQEWLIAGLIHL